MRIGIDIDITLVETGVEWWKWLSDITESDTLDYPIGDVYLNHGRLSYNLTKYFSGLVNYPDIKPYSFWSKSDLYEELMPIKNSVKVLKRLSEAGHEIVFISHCKKGHIASKVRWLKRHFPFIEFGSNGGFIATKEKYYSDVDVMIDDRIDNLLPFKDNVIKIYFGSIYQDAPFNKHEVDFITNDDCNLGWKELESYFEELEII